MFSALQVLVASALCGPFAGAWLLRRNLRLAGRPAAARVAVLLGALLTVLVFPLAVLVRAMVPAMPVEIVWVVPGLVVGAWAYALFPRVDPPLRATNGEAATPALVAALAVGGVVLVVFQVVRLTDRPLWLSDLWQRRVTVGTAAVYYRDGATAVDAHRAARALSAAGGAPKGVDVRVEGARGARRLAFAADCGREFEKAQEPALEQLARRMQQDSFPGEAVDLNLCSCTWEEKKRVTLPVGAGAASAVAGPSSTYSTQLVVVESPSPAISAAGDQLVE